jgi:hypothetical protein
MIDNPAVRRSMRGASPLINAAATPALTITLLVAIPVILLLVYTCFALSRRPKGVKGSPGTGSKITPSVGLRVAVPRGAPVVHTGTYPTIITTATAAGLQSPAPYGLRCRTPVSTSPSTTPMTTSP